MLKGLAPEPPPIDRKRTPPKVGLGHSPCHRHQPDLRILTRSACSPPAGDIARRRLACPCFWDSQSDTAVVGGWGAGCGVYPRFHRLPEGQATRDGMVVRTEGILGYGGGSRGARRVGSGVRAPDYSLLHDFLARLGAVGSGGFSRADHHPGDILRRAGRDRGGHAQQLSGVRIAGGDADIFQSGADSVFAGSCVPAGDGNGAGSFSNPGGGDRVRDSAGRDRPVRDSDSGAGAAGHAISVRRSHSAIRECRKWRA